MKISREGNENDSNSSNSEESNAALDHIREELNSWKMSPEHSTGRLREEFEDQCQDKLLELTSKKQISANLKMECKW